MSIANKIMICLFCSSTACATASLIDEWAACEACLLSYLNCGGCCWTICAPICHSFTIGDFGKGMEQFVKGAKLCVYGCVISMIAPVDGCINCLFYQKKNFESGVSGFSDVLENCKFIAKKLEPAFEAKPSVEPEATYKTRSP